MQGSSLNALLFCDIMAYHNNSSVFGLGHLESMYFKLLFYGNKSIFRRHFGKLLWTNIKRSYDPEKYP